MVKRLFPIFLIGGLLLVSCGKREAKDVVDALPAIFPNYAEVTVPCNIAPLNFEVKEAKHIAVRLVNERGGELLCEGEPAICMDEAEWKALIAGGGDVTVEVSVWDEAHPDGAKYCPFSIHVSKDSIDSYITYRLIPPGYEGWNQMGIYQRSLSDFEETTVLDNAADKTKCMNCHATCQGNPASAVYHVRGEGGYTCIRHNGKEEKIDLRKVAEGRHGSHPAWHPSGRYIAFSSNNTKQIFYAKSRDKIEAFDVWSDLFVYDVESRMAILDERFTDSLHWEAYPAFSPDGKWLYFSTARPVHMPEQAKELHYDLVRVAFDEATGKLGQADTIYSTAQRGGTALMPRLSPDGRFLLYTVADYGAFNLYHKESNFEMMEIKTPETKTLQLPKAEEKQPVVNEGAKGGMVDGPIGGLIDCSMINSNDAESYHAWSSNGKWMMFSSKRIDGRYTRLFITHWDGKQWTKPFLLPQRNPEFNTLSMMAYNVGEFCRSKIVD